MALAQVRGLLSRWRSNKSVEWKRVSRYLFVFFFVVVLAFFLHFREVRVSYLELNSYAEKYVLAKVGFEFPDKEAARLIKNEALQDIGTMYCFKDEEVVKTAGKIVQDLKGKWRSVLPGVTFQELEKAGERVCVSLLNISIVDDRTAAKLKELPAPFKDYQTMNYVPEQLTASIPDHVWNQIGADETPAFNYIWQKLKNYRWTLVEDLTTQNAVRHLIKNSIPIKMTKIEPGARIINAGEKVTKRHINMMEGMKKALSEQSYKMTPLSVIGSLALSGIFTLIGGLFFRRYYPEYVRSLSKMGLIGSITLFTLAVARLAEYLLINNTGFAECCRYPVFVLFATLTLSILLDRRVAMLISGFISMILTATLAIGYHHFLFINLTMTVMTLLLIGRVRKRKDIFVVCTKIWAITIPLIIAMNLLENSLSGFHFLADVGMTFACLLATGILVVSMLPILETAFGVVTDMTLMETADSSHPLLRRLNLEAPGTYQHSLAVASLAEEAALAINANGVFCRVAALYHDVGKLVNPDYFSENQSVGLNIHDLISPLESANVIISHVAEGVKLAQQYELPESVIDVIREHHGTTVAYFFLHKHWENNGTHTGDEHCFQYKGPTPRSRESAIIMLADSVEAAYRSLDNVTEKIVMELVETIVTEKSRQHQLDASNLTFNEIEVIKEALIHDLVIAGHRRVKYPRPRPIEDVLGSVAQL